MHTEKDYLEAGMHHAIEKALIEGINCERYVSHPSDLRLFKISGITNLIATVDILDTSVCPVKVLESKTFPLDELFNSEVAINHGRKVLHPKENK